MAVAESGTATGGFWEKAFKEMNENGDDLLLFNDVFENENLEEWI